MSKYETHEPHLCRCPTPMLAALLAAIGAAGCQNGIAPIGATTSTFEARVAAQAPARSAGETAARATRAAHVQESVSDDALELRLNDALIFDPFLPPSEISLTVWHGQVRLTGAVGTIFDRIEAAVIAGRVSGVWSVDNQLEVLRPGTALCFLGAP